uniref:Uncharacterized protein n=1 Tax=Marmota marmota marmota TaxID=9994 RepID=A0A8C5Z3Y9_MARMA
MDLSKEVIGVPAGTVVPQELLEEMVWVFRVEDGSPWNYSILALAAVVVVISLALLGRSIQANREQIYPAALVIQLEEAGHEGLWTLSLTKEVQEDPDVELESSYPGQPTAPSLLPAWRGKVLEIPLPGTFPCPS